MQQKRTMSIEEIVEELNAGKTVIGVAKENNITRCRVYQLLQKAGYKNIWVKK